MMRPYTTLNHLNLASGANGPFQGPRPNAASLTGFKVQAAPRSPIAEGRNS